MVKLVNIGRDEHFIWCDYIPEGKELPGFIMIDIVNDEIAQINESPYEIDTGVHWYSHHTQLRLIQIKNLSELPEITAAIWY